MRLLLHTSPAPRNRPPPQRFGLFRETTLLSQPASLATAWGGW